MYVFSEVKWFSPKQVSWTGYAAQLMQILCNFHSRIRQFTATLWKKNTCVNKNVKVGQRYGQRLTEVQGFFILIVYLHQTILLKTNSLIFFFSGRSDGGPLTSTSCIIKYSFSLLLADWHCTLAVNSHDRISVFPVFSSELLKSSV